MTEPGRPADPARRDLDQMDTVDLGDVSVRRESRADSAWHVASASVIGAVHVRDELPIQDAVLSWTDGGQAVVAVADGHGHHLHFRSETGSALAVVSAVEVLRRLVPALNDPETAADQLQRAAEDLIEAWTAKIHHHLEANPYSAEEDRLGASSDPLRAYGTTLLALAVTGDLLVVLQIGDGDAVLVTSRGEAFRPLPEDPQLDGVHTTSLCQPEPLRALRSAVVDVRIEDVALGFLCTDGFSTSRVDHDGWWRQTGQQLLEYARTRGTAWVAEQLPSWLEEPAQVGGDDTTMAVLMRADLSH